jgi:hypothetical protein
MGLRRHCSGRCSRKHGRVGVGDIVERRSPQTSSPAAVGVRLFVVALRRLRRWRRTLTRPRRRRDTARDGRRRRIRGRSAGLARADHPRRVTPAGRTLVRQVVRELVREQLNGNLQAAAETAVDGRENGQEPRLLPGPTPKPAPAERRCNRCGETKPAGEYGRGRGTCRSCRRAQQREHDRRAALAEDEEPHSGGQGLSVDRWLLERGLAEQRGVALIATPAGRELGAALLD